MSLIVIFLIALTLSMDAFSLALIYGTLITNNKKQLLISIVVGLFHFIMPILGYFVGDIILDFIKVKPDYVVGIILFILGMEMITSINKEEKLRKLTNLLSIIIFSLTVSIDSLSIGIGFGVTHTNILLSSIIFSLISFIFTYIGLKLGKILSDKFGKISVLIASIILIILGIYNFL